MNEPKKNISIVYKTTLRSRSYHYSVKHCFESIYQHGSQAFVLGFSPNETDRYVDELFSGKVTE